jgi:hypothetical protein
VPKKEKMARRRRKRVDGRVWSVCRDVFLALWVGGMALRAGWVLLAPVARFVDAVAVTLSSTLAR